MFYSTACFQIASKFIYLVLKHDPKLSKLLKYSRKVVPHTDLNRGPPDYKFDLGRFTGVHRTS